MLDFSVTFIITVLNIAILFFILRAILFKPVTKFMEARAEKVQSSIEQAEKSREEAGRLLAQYEDQLKKARDEADGIISSARVKAAEQADRLRAEGKDEAERLITAARKQIETEQKAAMTLFRAEAAALVIAASSRLIQRELTKEDSLRQAALLLQEIRANS